MAKNGLSTLAPVLKFLKTGTCSQAILGSLDSAFDHPLETEESAVDSLAGGILQHGYQCGMLWGASLAAGAQAYRLFGPGPQAQTEAMIASQKLVESYRGLYNHINCFEVTETKMQTKMEIFRFLLKGGPIGCLRMSSKYGRVAFNEINAAFSEKQVKAPFSPVSCAAMLAQKMGASELHSAMVAGFAGGIGFSGGACGALGAAIWIIGMNNPTERAYKMGAGTKVGDTMNRFLKSTEYTFECSKLVGRKFESIEDHACFLNDGGCLKIFDALAAN